MIRCILLLFLFALPAFAQKNMYEAKTVGSVLSWTSATTPSEPWDSQGNGGGEWTVVLNQPIAEVPVACIYGPLHITDGADILRGGSICYRGGHGSLHLMDFGGGPFFLDDEGYVFHFFIRYDPPRADVRDFANGVH